MYLSWTQFFSSEDVTLRISLVSGDRLPSHPCWASWRWAAHLGRGPPRPLWCPSWDLAFPWAEMRTEHGHVRMIYITLGRGSRFFLHSFGRQPQPNFKGKWEMQFSSILMMWRRDWRSTGLPHGCFWCGVKEVFIEVLQQGMLGHIGLPRQMCVDFKMATHEFIYRAVRTPG